MSTRRFFRRQLARLPLVDGLFRRFIWSRIHFPEVEMRFLSDLPHGHVDIAIDVGAALGSYAWVLNRVSRKVYAFEPGIDHHRYLDRLLVGSRIELVRSAVGGVTGRAKLYTPGADSEARHSATLSRDNPAAACPDIRVDEVDQIRLDDFLAQRLTQGDSVDVLKIDVEGYELEVLSGAIETLSSHYPLIICEIEARHSSEYGRVFDLLSGLQYTCFVFRGTTARPFEGGPIEYIQEDADLRSRLSGEYDPLANTYINNFVFQHPRSRIKVST